MNCKSTYTLQKTVGFVAYVLGLWAWKYFSWQNAHSPYRFWLVLLPVLPIVHLTLIFNRQLSEKDEMWRKIITESLAFSAIATAWTCLSYLFVREIGGPEFHAEWAWYLAVAYYLVGNFFIRRRYR